MILSYEWFLLRLSTLACAAGNVDLVSAGRWFYDFATVAANFHPHHSETFAQFPSSHLCFLGQASITPSSCLLTLPSRLATGRHQWRSQRHRPCGCQVLPLAGYEGSDRRPQRGERAVGKPGAGAKGESYVGLLDVSDQTSVSLFRRSVFEKFGGANLTVLMANAGVGGPTKASTSEGWDRILSTNFHGVVNV